MPFKLYIKKEMWNKNLLKHLNMCVTCIFSSHIKVKFHHNLSSYRLLQQTSGPHIVAFHFLLLYISKYKIKYGLPEYKTHDIGVRAGHIRSCVLTRNLETLVSVGQAFSVSWNPAHDSLEGIYLFLNLRSLTYLRRPRWNRKAGHQP